MSTPDEVKIIVEEARNFLCRLVAHELKEGGWRSDWTPDGCIDLHLNPPLRPETATTADIMARILESAQNRQSSPNVILGRVSGGLDGLRNLLHGFDTVKIAAEWPDDEVGHSKLLKHIMTSGLVRGTIADGPRSLWPLYCRSITSAAKFMSRFPQPVAFHAWAKRFVDHPDMAAALPLVLSQEIKGIGLALACEFLKELGYTEYVKPDVHIRKLAVGLGLSDAASDYWLLRDLMALRDALEAIYVTPYSFDKLLWLIGSGRFYECVQNGRVLDVGRQADAFLAYFRKASITTLYSVN